MRRKMEVHYKQTSDPVSSNTQKGILSNIKNSEKRDNINLIKSTLSLSNTVR